MAKTKWTIGCDPGFKETGLVLRHEDPHGVAAWATLRCKAGDPEFSRALSLAKQIDQTVSYWIGDYEIEDLEFVIETPIWAQNPHSFEIQWRLVQEIESQLFLRSDEYRQFWLQVEGVMQFYLTEVGPSTSKKLATGHGAATKDEILATSPFPLDPAVRAAYLEGDALTATEMHTQTTLSDAWAHSLAAWGGCRDCTRIPIDFNYSEVQHVCEGNV